MRGGIVITADDVTIRDRHGRRRRARDRGRRRATASGSSDVRVEGAELDGIHVRRGQVEIRDCVIRSLPARLRRRESTSRSASTRARASSSGCTIAGGLRGDRHPLRAGAWSRDNRVSETELRAITMTEMSMGKIEDNDVDGAHGVGIFCGDYSDVRDRGQHGRRTSGPTATRGDRSRNGVAIQAHYGAEAELEDNEIVASPGGIAAVSDATIDTPVSPPRLQLIARTGHPNFLDLPWDEPLEEWESERLVEVVRGIHRHVVRFVEYEPARSTRSRSCPSARAARVRAPAPLEDEEMPVVEAVGVVTERGDDLEAVLITRHLEYSLPFRTLFARGSVPDLRPRLLDAAPSCSSACTWAASSGATARSRTRSSAATPARSPPTSSTPRPASSIPASRTASGRTTSRSRRRTSPASCSTSRPSSAATASSTRRRRPPSWSSATSRSGTS